MRPPKLNRNLNRQAAESKGVQLTVRGIFTENFSLKLFAVVMAVVMWGFVATQRRGESTEIRFTTPLVFKNIPANMEVVDIAVQSVSVLVGLDRSVGASVNPSQFQVTIDLEDRLPGPVQFILTENDITYNNQPAPPGVNVSQITPRVLLFTLEQSIEKEVVIRPRYFGDTAKGYTIESIRIEPPQALLKGARSTLENLNRIYTRPLDIQDLQSDVEMLVGLDLTPNLRHAKKDSFFQAFIKVTQNASRLVIREIPVVVENAANPYRTSTKTVNVFLEGPEEIMQSLTRENVYAVLDLSKYPPGDYRGQTPVVRVPDTVKVLEQWPIIDLFVIKRPQKKSG